MLKRFHKIYESCLSLVYPPLCHHCEALLESSEHIFCQGCVSSLEMIDAAGRCKTCFCPLQNSAENLCVKCRMNPMPFRGVAAVFNYEGPAATLIKRLKQGSQPHLAKSAGAYLVAQWGVLKWPMPDIIVPVPQKFTHWMDRGYNQSHLLAASVGSLLSRPVASILKCRGEGFSQTSLTKEQRELFPNDKIIVRKAKRDFSDKMILLIDDVVTTGSTLRACGRAILEQCPSSIYALTVCRSN